MVLALDPQELAAHRPSYRCLSWVLVALGHSVDADLVGDDRPDEVAALYADAHDWLEGGGEPERGGPGPFRSGELPRA